MSPTDPTRERHGYNLQDLNDAASASERFGDDALEQYAAEHRAIVEGRAIRCPTCKKISYHPEDINQAYCGHCHAFHADMAARVVTGG